MEDQKRKNYLVYFKLGVVDAVVNNMADNSYMKSSAYYKKGFEFGLTMNQDCEPTINKIKVWLQEQIILYMMMMTVENQPCLREGMNVLKVY